MFVNPVLVGVLGTLLVELAALTIYALYLVWRTKK